MKYLKHKIVASQSLPVLVVQWLQGHCYYYY
jgi:hypothetical protein